MKRSFRLAFAFALVSAACGSAPGASTAPSLPKSALAPAPAPGASPATARPLLRLPHDVRPTAEAIDLVVSPEQDRFSGKVDIDVVLDQPRAKIWLHARGLHVTVAMVTPDGADALAATWGDEDAHGLGALTVAAAVPAGRARIHVEYDAPFMAGTIGLFKTKQGGLAYAFTQFEAIDARRAFPSFDEPSFKIPFTLALHVPAGDQAVANTPELGRETETGGLVHVWFAPTKPLPSYLVAFGVGPLDIVAAPDVPPNRVRARPLPLRAVTAKGRGKEVAYALSRAGQILSMLEDYFGIEYPYEKLDLLAVPDMGGAMENAGAVTFGEQILLFDEKTAPLAQRSAYAMITAHELSHQWFGDLVTMAWWDDTWLNESFAEWMGFKIARELDPALHEELDFADGTQQSMATDSLVNARQIHQAISTPDDIENAFDETTYQKGGAVIAMFERWLGPEIFRKGVALHLSQHRFGNAQADDFSSALSTAAGKDVATPFRTFLDQPGLPYLHASVTCDGGTPRVHLAQSRFLPLGTAGAPDETWQVPVCAKYAVGGRVKESCTLLASKEGDLPLDAASCPDWVFPNADGAGYYRFSLAPADLARLRNAALPSLTTLEKMAYGNSLRAAYSTGAAHFDEVLSAAAPLAADPSSRVASEPTGFVGTAREWLYADPVRPAIESYGQRLFAAAYARLGWDRRPAEGAEEISLRGLVIGFLANTGRDARVRAEAKRRALAYIGYGKDSAIHRDAVDQNLVTVALDVLGTDADPPTFDAMLALFSKTDDDQVRGALLGGLASVNDPSLALRARALSLDDRLKSTEMLTPLFAQMGAVETRDATWAWLEDHWEAVAARASGAMFAGEALVSMAGEYCDDEHAARVAAFLKDRVGKIDGGERVLAKALERIHICAARRAAEQGSARDFFGAARRGAR